MNDLLLSVLIMFFGSFIIQFGLMSMIMTDNFSNITISIGKIYLSLIMAFSMVVLELFMFYMHNKSIYNIIYIILCFIPIIYLIYLYRNQEYIYDNDYLKEMIEHHSMAVLTSSNISFKTKNENVRNLANNIINVQKKEINEMKKIITQ
jgi:Ca2+/Na+ antiporter